MEIAVVNEGTTNEMIKVSGIEGDMGEDSRLALIQQPDGDVILTIYNTKKIIVESIEFCSSSGGGHYPDLTKKLREIIALLRAK